MDMTFTGTYSYHLQPTIKVQSSTGTIEGLRFSVAYLQMTNSASYLELLGNYGGGAAAANGARLFVDAGGAGGKHRLLVQFQAGSAVVLATEP